MQNIEIVKICGKLKSIGVSAASGAVTTASVKFTLLAEMINAEWICSTSNLSNCTANETQVIWVQLISKQHASSLGLSRLHGIRNEGTYCSDKIQVK